MLEPQRCYFVVRYVQVFYVDRQPRPTVVGTQAICQSFEAIVGDIVFGEIQFEKGEGVDVVHKYGHVFKGELVFAERKLLQRRIVDALEAYLQALVAEVDLIHF